MDPVGADRNDVADVQLVGKQVALPAHRNERVAAVEDRAVRLAMLDPQLPLVALRPAVIVQFRQHQDCGIDRHMAANLLMFRQRQRGRRFHHRHLVLPGIRHHAECDALGKQHVIAGLIDEAPKLGRELSGALVHEMQR